MTPAWAATAAIAMLQHGSVNSEPTFGFESLESEYQRMQGYLESLVQEKSQQHLMIIYESRLELNYVIKQHDLYIKII